jgi:tetratricopeptide (TPR) repeat protein
MRTPFSSCCRWLAAALVLFLGAGASGDEPHSDTKAIMAEIVEALRVILPLSLDGARFGDPSNRAVVDSALESLASNAKSLESHSANRELGFAHLSGSLARDSADIRKRFAEGRVDEAQFLLQHLTETCVACHSRLPDARQHSLGKRLTQENVIAALPREERAQFEIATRQFDRALATYESLFADPDASIAELDLSGDLENYLELCLRVQGNPDHAISSLERLAERKDLPKRLKPNLEIWIEALQSLEPQPESNAIEQARELVRPVLEGVRGSGSSELIRLITASGLLHRYVASTIDVPQRVGEAYYLLGVVESRIGRSFWASQAEFFLETAIRMGPKEHYAEAAFSLLEEFLVSGYTGSAGTHIPPDVVERLRKLDELMKRAREVEPG